MLCTRPDTALFTAALLVLCLSKSTVGQTVATSGTGPRHPILQKWIDGQEKLKSVEFRVKVKETQLQDQEGSKVDIITEQHSYISPECCRHNVLQQWQLPNQSPRGGVWLEFEDRIVSWNKVPHAVIRVGELGDWKGPMSVRAFDPRLVPFTTRLRTDSLTYGESVRRHTRFMHQHGEPAHTTQSTSVEFIPGLLSRLYSPMYSKRRITFDTTKNFSPTSVTFHRLSPKDDPTEETGFLSERIHSNFVRIGELWLPETVIINLYSPLYDAGYASRQEIQFEYLSVNQEIDAGVFDVNQFGARDGLSISDYRKDPTGSLLSKVGKCLPNGDPK